MSEKENGAKKGLAFRVRGGEEDSICI